MLAILAFLLLRHFATTTAQQPAYITDLPQFLALEACATTAVYQALEDSNSDCDPGWPATEIASCLCLKDNNSARLQQELVEWVQYYCESTATQDITSVLSVQSMYCAPVIALANSPPEASVTILTDGPQFSALAQCATTAIQNVLGEDFDGDCNADWPATQIASCLCLKNHNSAAVESLFAVSVSYYCDATASDDFSSVLSLYSTYCGGAKAIPTSPIPSFTGYITDASAYTALANCATTAVLDVLEDFAYDCTLDAPVAEVASCLCIKDQNSAALATSLVISVSYFCANTATDDFSSVLALQAAYCLQAGVTNTMAPTFSHASPTASPMPGMTYSSPLGPTQSSPSAFPLSSTQSSQATSPSSKAGSSSSSSSSSGSNLNGGEIAGVALGVVAAIAGVISAIYAVKQYRKKRS